MCDKSKAVDLQLELQNLKLMTVIKRVTIKFGWKGKKSHNNEFWAILPQVGIFLLLSFRTGLTSLSETNYTCCEGSGLWNCLCCCGELQGRCSIVLLLPSAHGQWFLYGRMCVSVLCPFRTHDVCLCVCIESVSLRMTARAGSSAWFMCVLWSMAVCSHTCMHHWCTVSKTVILFVVHTRYGV